VAAAVSASFNAPIAGAFFALEVVIGHYALSAFTPVVIASVAGTIVARIHLGDYPAFILGDFQLTSFLELPAFALLGVVCAIVSVIFMRSIVFTQSVWKGTFVPTWLRLAIGGAAVGALALVLPEILGVGYEATDQALHGALPLWLLLALIAASVMPELSSSPGSLHHCRHGRGGRCGSRRAHIHHPDRFRADRQL